MTVLILTCATVRDPVAIGHTNARGGAVPREADVVILHPHIAAQLSSARERLQCLLRVLDIHGHVYPRPLAQRKGGSCRVGTRTGFVCARSGSSP
jgi:hypothetical protein